VPQTVVDTGQDGIEHGSYLLVYRRAEYEQFEKPAGRQ
jgi:hypothetical protein